MFKEAPPVGTPSAGNIQGALHTNSYMGRKRKKLRKSDPETLYIYRPVLNAVDIVTWAKSVGFQTTLLPDDMHVTIAYSHQPVDWDAVGISPLEYILITAGDRAIARFDEGVSVLQIESPDLGARWRQVKDAGAVWKYPDYKPHISISYDGPKEAVLWEPYRGPILLGSEVFQEVKDGWKDRIVEKKATLSQDEVGYQFRPNGSEQCSKCSMFAEPSSCTLVKGKISSTGWCRRFDTKTDDTMEKIGARNSKSDLTRIQAVHDHAVDLGATCNGHSSNMDDEMIDQDNPDIEKFRIAKVDDSLGLVFGYAIICKANGADYYDLNVDVDSGQRVPEHIPESTMLKAASEFMQSARPGNEMHSGPDKGQFVFAFPLTSDIAKALGIQTNVTGLLVGFKPPADLLAKFKDGTYKGFSIEGSRIAVQDID